MGAVEMFGIRFSALPYGDAIDRMLLAATEGPQLRVHFANVHSTDEAVRDPALAAVFRSAGMVCTDGMPLVWLARRRGAPQAERVSGPDAMLTLCDRGRPLGLRHYLLGGRPGVAEAVARRLTARFPGLIIAGTHTPPFRAGAAIEDESVIEAINQTRPDVLWVALGAPKQEFWTAAHEARLGARLILSVGAAFDFHSGRVRRAPAWMRRAGLEWLFRLASEPRRLAPRYVVTNLRFVGLVLGDAFRRRREAGS